MNDGVAGCRSLRRTRTPRSAPRPGLEPTPVEKLAFQRGEEALAHRIVVGVANRAHRWAHPGFAAAVAELNGGVLAEARFTCDDLAGRGYSGSSSQFRCTRDASVFNNLGFNWRHWGIHDRRTDRLRRALIWVSSKAQVMIFGAATARSAPWCAEERVIT